MLPKAKTRFFLLSPFHLECGLPKLDYIYNYAERKGIEVTVKANGKITTKMAIVYMSYFSTRLGEIDSLKNVNIVYNGYFTEVLDSETTPTAYSIYFEVDKSIH